MSEELTEFPAYRHTKEKLEEFAKQTATTPNFGWPEISILVSVIPYGTSLSQSLKRLGNL